MTDDTKPTLEQDLKEIRAVHDKWLFSNNGLIIDEMVPNFADPGYYQFNLNGHTYANMEEKVHLWHGFHSIGFNLENSHEVGEPMIYAEGDIAYIMAIWSTVITGEEASGIMVPDPEPVVFRVTEVLRRNDGKGNPIWKIWHFHASPVAPAELVKFPQDA